MRGQTQVTIQKQISVSKRKSSSLFVKENIFSRVAKEKAPYLCGLQEMEDVIQILATVMATPIASSHCLYLVRHKEGECLFCLLSMYSWTILQDHLSGKSKHWITDIKKIGIKIRIILTYKELRILQDDCKLIWKAQHMINEMFQPHRSICQLREHTYLVKMHISKFLLAVYQLIMDSIMPKHSFFR